MEGFPAEFLLDPKVPEIIRHAVLAAIVCIILSILMLAMGTAAAVKIHRNEKEG